MDIDFATMLVAVASNSIGAAIVALGVVKLFPTFTMWAVDKVAGMFGYDPYDRDNKHDD